MMAPLFRDLYDNPPHGTIQDADTTCKETFNSTQPVSSNDLEIVDAPELADDLGRWAQWYFDQVRYSPN